MLVSAVPQSDSYIYICIYGYVHFFFIFIFFSIISGEGHAVKEQNRGEEEI